MKFRLPDGDGYQEITIRENADGDICVDLVLAEDVTAILEANKRAQREAPLTLGSGTQTSMRQIADLSALQAHMLMRQGIFWDDKALRKWCNDLDNYLWRVTAKGHSIYHEVPDVQSLQAH